MQTSTLGLLRSFVYRFVKRFPDLKSLLAESEPMSDLRGVLYDSD